MGLRLRYLASVAVAVGFSAQAAAAPLRDDLQQLVASHPLIKSGEAQVSSADKGVAASLGPLLPSFELAGGAGFERVESPTFATAPGGRFSEEANNYSATLKQNIWDGGSRWSARSSAKIQKEITTTALKNTRQTVLLEGIAAYLGVLRQQELLQLSNQNSDNIRKQLNLEDERVRRGSGIAVDVLQAK